MSGRIALQRAFADGLMCVEPVPNHPCMGPVSYKVTHPEYGEVHYCSPHPQSDPWADGLAEIERIRP